MNANTNRQHAQQLLSHLAPDQIYAVVHVMEGMLDSVSLALANAPFEDEEISENGEQAVVEGREWLKHNTPFSHEDVLAELGLSMADFELMGLSPVEQPNEIELSSRT